MLAFLPETHNIQIFPSPLHAVKIKQPDTFVRAL